MPADIFARYNQQIRNETPDTAPFLIRSLRRDRSSVPDEEQAQTCIYALQYDLSQRIFAPCQPAHQVVSSLFFEYCCCAGHDVWDKFLLVKFQLPEEANIDHTTSDSRCSPKPRGACPNSYVVDGLIEQVLRRGIHFLTDGSVFHVVGSSNSGVQMRSFFFYRVDSQGPAECQRLLRLFVPRLEDLDRTKSVAKRVKYAGLLFTGCQLVAELPHTTEVRHSLPAICDDQFTDGCGLISWGLADILRRQAPSLRGLPDPPSVWQVRYCGYGFLCKGVLVVDTAAKTECYMGFRRSLQKVPTSPPPSGPPGPFRSDAEAAALLKGRLGIVAWSKRTVGRLNKQVVALLSAFMPDHELLEIQAEQLGSVRSAAEDPLSALRCSAAHGEPAFDAFLALLRRRVLQHHPPAEFLRVLAAARDLCRGDRLQVPLAASRLLLGASLPEQLHTFLKEGQCVVLTESGPHEGLVLVSRSPSYSPGDLRVLRAVAPPLGSPAAELRNCILFCTVGPRADADKMSGGDLDGDLYLVIWDARILRHADRIGAEPAASYDTPPLTAARGDEDWVRYMARWDNVMLGRIDRCFFRMAREKGIRSRECAELCVLFSRAVDQHASDVDRLAQLELACGGDGGELRALNAMLLGADTGDTSEADIESQLPLWDRMLQRQLLTAERIRAWTDPRECRRLWANFYRRLFAWPLVSENRISGVLSKDAGIQNNIPAAKTRRCHGVWSQLVRDARCRPGSRIRWGPGTLSDDRDVGDWNNQDGWDDDASRASTFAPTLAAREEGVAAFVANIRAAALRVFQPEIAQFEAEVVRCEAEVGEEYALLVRASAEIDARRRVAQGKLAEHQDAIAQLEALWGLASRALDEAIAGLASDRSALEAQAETLQVTKFNAMGRLRFVGPLVERLLPPMVSSWFLLFWWPVLKGAFRELDRQRDAVRELDGKCGDEMRRREAKQREFEREMCALKDRTRPLLAELAAVKQQRSDLLSGTLRRRVEDRVRVQRVLLCDAELLRDEAGSAQALRNKSNPVAARDENCDGATLAPHARRELEDLESALKNTHSPERLATARARLEHTLGKLHGCELALSAIDRECDRTEFITGAARERRQHELRVCLTREEQRLRPATPDERLPVYAKRAEVVRALSDHDAVVITAGAGCGKSTQLPQYLVDDLHHAIKLRGAAAVVCTQPRRLAAKRIAARVAEEYGACPGGADRPRLWPALDVGGWVGFHVGGHGAAPVPPGSGNPNRRTSELTKLMFVTEGLLLQQMKTARGSDLRYDCVIIDEAHERGRDTDLLLAHVQRRLLENRDAGGHEDRAPDGAPANSGPKPLKVVVMSASIDAARFCRYLGGCPVIDCPGRMFHVETCWPETLRPEPFRFDPEGHADLDGEALVQRALTVLFDHVVGREEGDVLIFLPGAREIHRCVDQINGRARREGRAIAAYPLYAAQPPAEQDVATDENERDLARCGGSRNSTNEGGVGEDAQGFRKGALQTDGRGCSAENRKVVCCTNIAETSLTIPRVRFVIDSGKAKKLSYDHELRLNVLEVGDISRAAASQRKGRGGRTAPGWFFPLYSEAYHDRSMRDYEEPQMRQAPVEELILYALDVCGGSVEDLGLMDPPEPVAIQNARDRLLNLGFVEESLSGAHSGSRERDLRMTDDGRFALSLSPLDLESARMILAAEDLDCTEDALKLAALLAQRDGDVFEKAGAAHQQAGTAREGRCVSSAGSRWTTSSGFGGSSGFAATGAPVNRQEEEKLRYLSDLGDHFTSLAVFKAYENEQVTSKRDPDHMRTWCAERGLSFAVLRAAEESVKKGYEVLKRNKRLGAVRGTTATATEKDLKLCRALIAGYFHNIACPHDARSLKSGFSMVTPMSHAPCGSAPGETHLLKLQVSSSSAVFVHGDVEPNTFVIFGTISRARSGRCFIKMVSRIPEDWILENAAERWRQRVGFRKGECGVITRVVEHVGPQLLVAALLQKSEAGQQPVAVIEAETNCCIDVDMDRAQVRLYGSGSETRAGEVLVRRRVAEMKAEFRDNSRPVTFPRGAVRELQCDIDNGVRVVGDSFRGDLCAQHMPGWDHVEGGAIVFFRVDSGVDESERIRELLELLASDLRECAHGQAAGSTLRNGAVATSHALGSFWGQKVRSSRQDGSTARVMGMQGRCASNPNADVVQSVERHRNATGYTARLVSVAEAKRLYHRRLAGFDVLLRYGFPRGAFAKLQEDVWISVCPTRLYPSVARLAAESFPAVRVDPRDGGFWIRKRDRRARTNAVAPFLQTLAGGRVLETARVGARHLEKLGGDRVCAHRALRRWREEYGRGGEVEILVSDRGNAVSVEILGELRPREAAKRFLEAKLDAFEHERFGEMVRFGPGQLLVAMANIDAWRCEFSGTSFQILRPGPVGAPHAEGAPRLQLWSESKAEAARARRAVESVLATVGGGVLSVEGMKKCCRCQQQVVVLRGGKTGDEEGGLQRNMQAFRTVPLTLCGCVYCSVCFQDTITRQLRAQQCPEGYRIADVRCEVCGEGVLTRDLGNVLTDCGRDEVFRLAVRSYLGTIAQEKGRVLVVCSACDTPALSDQHQKGIYRCRNSRCHQIYCAGCDQLVRNRLDFEAHVNCV